MEYPLSEEHQMFRETMQRFVDEEMIPVEMETIDENGELKPEWREKFHARSKELGLWKMEVPEEVTLKDPSAFKIIGTDIRNVDIDKLITGQHSPAEAGFFDTGEEEQGFRLDINHGDVRQHTACLRHCLDNQYARHHRFARKMTLEVRLVTGYVFQGSNRFADGAANDPVEHEERKTVRQRLHDLERIHRFDLVRHYQLSSCASFSNAETRSFSSPRRRKRATLRFHSRLSSPGKLPV